MNQIIIAMLPEEKIQQTLEIIREAKNYANRLLDTMVFTVCGFGIYFNTNLKQWLIEAKTTSTSMNLGIGTATFLFMAVISLNIIGQKLSKTLMDTDEEYYLEGLKKWNNKEKYDSKKEDRLDKKAQKLNNKIRIVNRFIYPGLFAAIGLSFILFVLV